MRAQRFPDWFWPLIESFNNDNTKMIAAFHAMPKRRLVAFYRQFKLAACEVNPQFWSDVESLGHSEDTNQDYADWVVSRGRSFYIRVLRHHGDIKTYFAEFNQHERTFENPAGVASVISYERFKTSLVQLAFP
jgi:hypothetical protein